MSEPRFHVALTAPVEPARVGNVSGELREFWRQQLLAADIGAYVLTQKMSHEGDWRNTIQNTGGLVIACYSHKEGVLPWDGMVLEQVAIAAKERKPIFTQVSPDDPDMESGMYLWTKSGRQTNGKVLREMRERSLVLTFGQDVQAIWDQLDAQAHNASEAAEYLES